MNSIVVHTSIMTGLIVIQTVLFPSGLIRGAVPDLALILLCFSANHHGSYRGQLSGFVSGLVLDGLSVAPLGFHSLIRTTIGFLYGLFRGKIFVDPILVPVIIVTIATLMKAFGAYLLASIFAPDIAGTIFTGRFGVELLMNAVVSPFAYGLLKGVGMIRPGASARV